MNSQEIIDARAELSRELNKVRAEAEHYERLTKARARVIQINKELAQLEKDFVDARNNEDHETRKLAASRLRNVTVKSDGRPMTIASYTISWEYMSYSTNSRGNMWEGRTVMGFTALSTAHDHVMQYILDRPELLPSEIRALCPGDAVEAMDRYFHALRRNSVSTGTVLSYCP
jgi:hypothetical protein